MRDLLDPAGDAETVQLAGANSLEDKQIESALEEGGLVLGHQTEAPIEQLYEFAMARTECQ
jgi:hypothetical protein